MEDSFNAGQKVTEEIMINVIDSYKIEGDKNQIKIGIRPLISNAMYDRDKGVLEEERMKTVMSLARALNTKNFNEAIKELGYQIRLSN